jgi:TatD DNase family protein
MMIETHCHLDYLKAESLEDIRQKIKDAGITKVVTIGVDPQNLDKVMELALTHEEIYFTQGIHPHDAKDATEIEFQKISERCHLPKMVAVGEIGLDYHYNNSPAEVQRKIFEHQLQIACDQDMPVVIHTRDAEEDTRAILKNFSSRLKRKGVIHSFTSSLELAEFVLGEGFYIGFNGIITFTNLTLAGTVGQDYVLRFTSSPALSSVDSDDVNVTAGPASKLVVTGTGTQTAGASQTVTITAYDANGNVATGYTGAKSLTFSGANLSPNSTEPTLAGENFGDATSLSFTAGVATGSMVLVKAETALVAVTDGEAGVFWIEGGALRCQRPPPVQVSDTTGAGDVFHGALAFALAASGLQSARRLLEFANAIAGDKVHKGLGSLGAPYARQVQAAIEQLNTSQ